MLLKPDYNVKTIFEVDYDALRELGIAALMFDLDSTVMKSRSGVFSSETLELFGKLEKDFSLIIVSNNKETTYIERAEAQIGFPIIGYANKPNPKIICNYLKDNNIEPNRAAIIGDRPLTDILAGKLAGIRTILVDSICWSEEPKLTRFVGRVERLVIK